MICDCCEKQVSAIRQGDLFTIISPEGHSTTRREYICKECWNDSAGFGTPFSNEEDEEDEEVRCMCLVCGVEGLCLVPKSRAKELDEQEDFEDFCVNKCEEKPDIPFAGMDFGDFHNPKCGICGYEYEEGEGLYNGRFRYIGEKDDLIESEEPAEDFEIVEDIICEDCDKNWEYCSDSKSYKPRNKL